MLFLVIFLIHYFSNKLFNVCIFDLIYLRLVWINAYSHEPNRNGLAIRGVTVWFGLVFRQKNVRTDEIFIDSVWFGFHCFLKKKPNQTNRFCSVWIGSVDRFVKKYN